METKSKMTRQEFVIETLLPYFQDPSTTAYSEGVGGCMYLTEDGRKCAFGKHIVKYLPEFEGCNANELYLKEGVLTEEAKQQEFGGKDWNAIQKVHDYLVMYVYPADFFSKSHHDVQDSILGLEDQLGIDLSVLKTELTKL